MVFFIVIRGPLGVGKSTLSKRLAQEIGAQYVSVDQILEENNLWEAGHLSEFLRANEFVAKRAGKSMAAGRPVIVDGNFYWKSQIQDLIERIAYRHYVFTLKAPLSVCVDRDSRRDNPYGREAASVVYAKSTKFVYGFEIDATRPVVSMIREIVARISEDSA